MQMHFPSFACIAIIRNKIRNGKGPFRQRSLRLQKTTWSILHFRCINENGLKWVENLIWIDALVRHGEVVTRFLGRRMASQKSTNHCNLHTNPLSALNPLALHTYSHPLTHTQTHRQTFMSTAKSSSILRFSFPSLRLISTNNNEPYLNLWLWESRAYSLGME